LQPWAEPWWVGWIGGMRIIWRNTFRTLWLTTTSGISGPNWLSQAEIQEPFLRFLLLRKVWIVCSDLGKSGIEATWNWYEYHCFWSFLWIVGSYQDGFVHLRPLGKNRFVQGSKWKSSSVNQKSRGWLWWKGRYARKRIGLSMKSDPFAERGKSPENQLLRKLKTRGTKKLNAVSWLALKGSLGNKVSLEESRRLHATLFFRQDKTQDFGS